MNAKHLGLITLVVAVLTFACCPYAMAQGKGGGKDKGGGGDPPKYSIVELEEMYWPRDMSNPAGADSDLWVAGANVNPGGSFIEAMYARITPEGDITVGFLPEVGDSSFDGASDAYAVNNLGDFAGYAKVLDINADPTPEDPFPTVSHAVVWIWSESANSFSYIDLDPNFAFQHSVANDLNNYEIAVGQARLVREDPFHARIWDLATGSSDDLNDFLPVGSGWFLTEATQVKDSGMIGGKGLLDGFERAFVLTLDPYPPTTQSVATVTAVPLLPGGGPYNDVAALTEDGRATGRATIWDDTRGTWSDRAYYWDGFSDSSVNLGTLTDHISYGSGVNIWGEVVGASQTPVYRGDWDSFATYWGTDRIPVALEDEIPDRPKWNLTGGAYEINDAGYILAWGGKSYRGGLLWMAVVLVPNEP